jgi:hypothetical protein
MKCLNCKSVIPSQIKIKNKIVRLTSRKFCLECSPLGSRNTRQYIIDTKDNESYCPRCQKIKEIGEFYNINNRVASYCKLCQQDVKKIKAEEKLHSLIEMKGSICVDCEIVFPTPVYVFYNGKKKFPVSKIQHLSMKKLIEKLENYFLICRNCKAVREWIASN